MNAELHWMDLMMKLEAESFMRIINQNKLEDKMGQVELSFGTVS